MSGTLAGVTSLGSEATLHGKMAKLPKRAETSCFYLPLVLIVYSSAPSPGIALSSAAVRVATATLLGLARTALGGASATWVIADSAA